MVPLPIVERELRAASRRKSTHRIRVYTALVASVASALFLMVYVVTGQMFRGMGQTFFTFLAYYAFALSLLAGIFFTADSISEEKRDGTLGLLFLTDLRGVDVVLGKLTSCGLATLYGLVAVMALPLMMGGTTGGQFWRTALALVNNLFFALAAGLLVSTISKEAHRAMLGTVGFLVFAVIALWALGELLSMWSFPWPFWYVSPLSAMYFGAASSYSSIVAHFWPALLVSHAFGWLMIGVASWLLPRIWQEKQFGRVRPASVAKPLVPPKKRRPLGEMNPIQWLMERSGNLRGPAWALGSIYVSLIVVVFLVCNFLFPSQLMLPKAAKSGTMLLARSRGINSAAMIIFRGAFGFGTGILSLLFKTFFAVQAGKFFTEARRSGALEIIMSTPLAVRDFIDGQWGGLKRSFLWPMIFFLAMQVGYALFSYHYIRGAISSGNVSGAFLTGLLNPVIPNDGWGLTLWQLMLQLYKALEWSANVVAIGWVGMWLGLSSKNPNLAPAMTILFVVILPNCVPCLPPAWIPDLIFIFWARRQLLENFRRYAFPQQWSYAGVPGLAPGPVRPPVART